MDTDDEYLHDDRLLLILAVSRMSKSINQTKLYKIMPLVQSITV